MSKAIKKKTPTKRIIQNKGAEEEQRQRAKALRFFGLLSHWDEFNRDPWLNQLLSVEEVERSRRSLERRIKSAKLGQFKPMGDFEWGWPKKIDRDLVEEVLEMRFMEECANVVLVGPNGVGKTMISKTLGHKVVLSGHTVRFTTVSEMLTDLGSCDSTSALARKLKVYTRPDLLVIDEVGYLSSTARHADLLFDVVNRRYQKKPIVLTTNKPFAEWNEMFPNSGCVVTLIDRLIHRAEIIQIDGDSYRLKEAKERQAVGAARRKKKETKRNAKATATKK